MNDKHPDEARAGQTAAHTEIDELQHWHDQWKMKALREQERAERAEAALDELPRAMNGPWEQYQLMREWRDHAKKAEEALRIVSDELATRTERTEKAEAALREFALEVENTASRPHLYERAVGIREAFEAGEHKETP